MSVSRIIESTRPSYRLRDRTKEKVVPGFSLMLDDNESRGKPENADSANAGSGLAKEGKFWG